MKKKYIAIWLALLISVAAYASTTTVNMLLTIPGTGDTDYPTSISNSFTLIDAHDHTTGKGVQIAAGGLATSAVTTAKILDGTIIAGDIASDAVTTAKILDANVTTAKIADANVTTAKIADANVTIAKMAPVPSSTPAPSATPAPAGSIAFSASSASFATSSASAVDVTGLSVSIVTTGRPVYVGLTPESGASHGYVSMSDSSSAGTGHVLLLRDGVSIYSTTIGASASGATAVTAYMPASSIHMVDLPSAGTYTYKVRVYGDGGDQVSVNATKLVAFEL